MIHEPSHAEQLYEEWKDEIEYALSQLMNNEYETVSALIQHAAMDKEDIYLECLSKILSQAEWIVKRQWIQSHKNPQGYFYQIAKNHLIDLWRKYERKGNTPHTSFETLDPFIQSPNNINPINQENIIHALAELIQYAEHIIRNTHNPQTWIEYQQTKQSIYEKWLT